MWGRAHRAEILGHREALERERRRYRDLREGLRQSPPAGEHRRVLGGVQQEMEENRHLHRKALEQNRWILTLADFCLGLRARMAGRLNPLKHPTGQDEGTRDAPDVSGGSPVPERPAPPETSAGTNPAPAGKTGS